MSNTFDGMAHTLEEFLEWAKGKKIRSVNWDKGRYIRDIVLRKIGSLFTCTDDNNQNNSFDYRRMWECYEEETTCFYVVWNDDTVYARNKHPTFKEAKI